MFLKMSLTTRQKISLISIRNKSPSEIRQLNKEDIEKPVTHEDFVAALERSSSTVQQNDVARHEKWIKQFGSY